MDDFVISNLNESRNEWCSRLVSIFTPLVMEGIRSVFNESYKLCSDNNEISKYLMTFQNFLKTIPSWNSFIIEQERKRIIERSGCNYLEDLISCVHIIQLKIMTCVRVGNKQKKIDISIPKLDDFIHKVYINTARKIYTNVYLFEKNISPLQTLRNNREFELMVQESIMTTIRDSIPVEELIRMYVQDENVEVEEIVVFEEVNPEEKTKETMENVEKKTKIEDDKKDDEENKIPTVVPSIKNIDDEKVITKLSFNDYDSVLDYETGKEAIINAPKDIDILGLGKTAIKNNSSLKIQKNEEDHDDELEERIKIHTENINLDESDYFNMNSEDETDEAEEDDIILDIEEL